jgi:hypothetical protein
MGRTIPGGAQVALPIPRGLMTLDEWDALPEDKSAH